jgi:hypothetical protein
MRSLVLTPRTSALRGLFALLFALVATLALAAPK